MTGKNSVVIVNAVRTPIGNFGGYYRGITTPQLGAIALNGAITQSGLKPEDIQEVLMGCVLTAALGQAPARQAAVLAKIPVGVPATTLNKVCGSSMKAAFVAHDEILAGSYQIIVAGGMENMTRAPYLVPGGRFGYRLGTGLLLDHMMFDGLEDAYQRGRSMGTFAEECATKYKIGRKEQDDYALQSLTRAKDATDKGEFKDEIVAITFKSDKGESVTIDKDEGPQRVKPERITSLPSVFAKEGTITAASSSSISDGAAAMVLMTEDEAHKRKLKPLARIAGHATFAGESAQFPTAPIGAIQKLMEKTGWKLKDVDLFEINEAFAVVPIVTMKELKIPADKVNVNGGALVLGHPIGASGARVVATLVHALKRRKLKRGVAVLCIGGGEATAMAIEII